ncbi:phosphoribosyl-ATP pyrophosphohydrolase [Neobacillus piezotolerans]|uniref:Phosphoribosyl-ATP pyrophosphohydrolase n=1 Tax=Neobacillus piezotolerans TaxID=2259171 RepID=A0A3D8GWU5_9BACI|nr:nucleoside triphosphate pyrophosphohydrolase [Neobacillus piezotolerans]RDU38914.1 phosphoribosyl-ATP pyrophosphohydrolase [Neobacillus piezotolerans]
MPEYNKLVRDKIPQIIKETGKSFSIKQLDDAEYIKELKKKCQEELLEYLSAEDDKEAIEELADILEIIHSLALQHGSSIEKVEETRRQKAEIRGGFKERIFLEMVED